MTWQELGALGELTGAFAAVVLLGYIAYQIRQNSRLLRTSTASAGAVQNDASNDPPAEPGAFMCEPLKAA